MTTRHVASARIPIISQCMEDGGGGSCRRFAGFPELSSFVMNLTNREYMGDLCDGEGDKSFTALAVVRSQIAYGPIMDPDPIRFVGGGVANIAGRYASNVPEAPVGLLMPVSGFLEVHAFCIVLTLPNAVIQGRIRI